MRSMILAAALLFAVPGVASAQNADFTLYNMTGYPIREVYVSPVKQKAWGSDRLGKHTIEHGGWWKLSFAQSRSQCRQDLKVVFDDDGSEVEWENFDLCTIDKIRLKYDRSTGVTTAEWE